MAADFDNLEKKAKEFFDDFYKKFDYRIKDLSNQIKDNFIPDTEEKLRQNVFKTVFISFIIGFITGILVILFGFKNSNKKKR